MSAWLAAVRGDTTAAQRDAAVVLGDARQGIATAQATWALAIVDLITGDAPAALRAGEAESARRFLPELTEWATHIASPVAAALQLRCLALLARGSDADELYQDSLRIDECGPYDRARTRLAYGAWLRRNRRPSAAKEPLGLAREVFEQIGAHCWNRQVRAELVALGDRVPDRSDTTGAGLLTPQELQVARRAARGMSNREIAAELFLSPRTVGYHLYKAYPKLGVRRRAELARHDL